MPDKSYTREAPPAVLYAAKSTEDRHGSIPTQLADCRQAAGRVVAEYQDEDESGWSGNRGSGLVSAKAHAVALAVEHGTAELWVQHTDRLARGDGLKADHLVEIFIDMRRSGVRLRSVQDDHNLASVSAVANAGDRNSGDSDRKSLAVRDGYRRTAQRGDCAWILRGIRLDGYVALRTFAENGRVILEAVKDPDRKQIFELGFEMALAGRSAQAIELEFSSRGFLTAPVRKDHRPRPFDATRVSHFLDNAAYAGLVVHHGEIVGPGNWPAYLDAEDFFRLRDERRVRCHHTKRTAGRPPAEPYLLSYLAVCGACGCRLRVETYRRTRADGSHARRYVCQNARTHHRGSAAHCDARPYDADLADRMVLGGLDSILLDADALRAQLNAGRSAQVERMGRVASDARRDAAKAERGAAKAHARYERALDEDDEMAAEITLTAVGNKRAEAQRATERLNAALDALSTESERDEADVLARLWEALSGRVAASGGDVRKLNAALRETFDSFELHHGPHGLRIIPVLSDEAQDRVMADGRARHPSYAVLELDLPEELDGLPAGTRLREVVVPTLTAVEEPAGTSLRDLVAPPITVVGNSPSTSQNASARPSKATMSSSPQRVR